VISRRLLALALAALALIGTGRCDVSVFDLPERHAAHLRLLSLMDASHRAGRFDAMEAACTKGLELGTNDELWSYNLACALALQGKAQEALAALDRAISLGFADAEQLRLDPDFASLREAEGFTQRLARLAESAAGRPARAPSRPALRPDAQLTVTQAASNTGWNAQLGLFHARVAVPTNPAPRAYGGPEAHLLRAWLQAGTASGCSGVLYANRDNNTQPVDAGRFPGLLRLAYSDEMTQRSLHIGMPNTLFSDETESALLPVIGHSSMGYLNSPFWRSQPRALSGDPRQLTLQSVLLLGNQLFFYPAYGDYDPVAGDLFPANTPYCFAVAGSNGAERPFVEAALAALAAMRPETRAELSRTGMLMPTLQMLFRASQRTGAARDDYLTGLAHPPAFLPANLNVERLVGLAHALTTNGLPPVVALALLRETKMVPDRDFFDTVKTEHLFDSPFALARVFRGAARTRTYDVLARCKRSDARLRWVVLQGDPDQVTFSPCPTNASLVTVTVAYHEPFAAPLGGGRTIPTSRVDIGVIAETPAGFSLPAILSVAFLTNERRVYAEDGRILSIDYTRRREGYCDPLLTSARNWKDTYRYDAQGNLTGWTRRRGLAEERFTAFGHKVVETDALGRATRAHLVRYVPRRIKADDAATDAAPDLAQADDNREILYRYASDSDFVGAPDLSSLTQATEPPASDL
jgi:YD repeat-containing protein